MRTTNTHVIHGVGATSAIAISDPTIESKRSTANDTNAATRPRGARPGATSSWRLMNEFGSSPNMKPSPAQAPSAPYSRAEIGHRPFASVGVAANNTTDSPQNDN